MLLGEGGHVGAHCAVLAAASPFLKSLLLAAADHPAIISVTGTYGTPPPPPLPPSFLASPRPLLLSLAARQ